MQTEDSRDSHPLPLGPSSGEAPPPPTISRAKLRRFGIIAGCVAVLIAVAGIVIRQVKAREVAHWTQVQAVPNVSVIIPTRGSGGGELVLPGNIDAWYAAPIYARVPGYLRMWYFDYGAHVKKGQILATIETPDLDGQYAAAQATLRAAKAKVNVWKAQMQFAKTTYERWRDSPKGVVSVQETESKKADYATAEASFEAALAEVNSDQGVVERLAALEQFKRIEAPFTGVVTARNTDIGDLINAGSGAGGGSAPPLFKMADVSEMRVYVQVPQAMSKGIEPGMTAELYLPQYPERLFKATVATTSQAINTSARTLLVELHAKNPDGLLQPGTYAEVHFHLPSDRNVLTIPATALVFQTAGMQVAVVGPDNRAELRSVSLGRNFGADVQVLRGLKPTDRVINSPPDSLTDGELVRVVGETGGGRVLASRDAAAAAHTAVSGARPGPVSRSSGGPNPG
jgi:RND family efflux transporter MFP subunit